MRLSRERVYAGDAAKQALRRQPRGGSADAYKRAAVLASVGIGVQTGGLPRSGREMVL